MSTSKEKVRHLELTPGSDHRHVSAGTMSSLTSKVSVEWHREKALGWVPHEGQSELAACWLVDW